MATSRRRTTRPSEESAAAPESAGASGAQALRRRVLKKYPNRRLYDTQNSTYITLQDVKDMVLQGQDFQVQDAKTAEDITRSILLQIILEEETGGVPMFSTPMLANIIRFYGHAMQGMMGHYLEQNLQAFADLQRQWTAQSKTLYDPTQFNTEAWGQWAKMFQSVPGFTGFPPGRK
jgi:polyhydroxyalkanoate synthesis repressor PhaR